MAVRDYGTYDTLAPSGTRTTSTTHDVVEGLGSAESLRVQLSVTAATGATPSMTVTIEDTLDGTNWNVLDTFTVVTAPAREVRNITAPFTDRIRARSAITGTAPSFTYEIISYTQ